MKQMFAAFFAAPLTLLLFPSPLVPGGNVHDAVGVDVKGHFNLGDPPGGRRDANLKSCQSNSGRNVEVMQWELVV